MKKLFIFLVLLATISEAGIETKKEIKIFDGIGVGTTRENAINNALIEAIGQMKGVYIEKSSASEDAIINSTKGSSATFKFNSNINKLTRGRVNSYKIKNVKQIGEYKYRAVVGIKKVKITKKYKTPGLNPNKRRKLAVFPFEYKNSYVIFNRNEDGKQVSDRFTQSLVTKITQARKFTVLDRENSKYYQAEKNFLLSGNSSKDELLKLGKRLGVDYMVVGKILDLKIGKVTETNNIGIPETSRLVCNATISYRILMMATQQIKWSETLSKSFNLKENRDINSAEAIVAIASDKISSYILENILNNIYPPRIVAVTANNIIVNQGGNSIREGEIFKVFAKGERLVDPYTKEYLGYEEIEAGKIVIKSVKPKVSYARLLEGRVSKGMILRRIKSENGKAAFHSEGEAETDVKIAPGGGVVLPFD